jgi:hypothetical protein
MQFSTIALFLGAALSASAAPAAAPVTELEVRDREYTIWIGWPEQGDMPISVWGQDGDVCDGKYGQLGPNSDANFCEQGFEQGGMKLVLKGCGYTAPEVWSVDGNGAAQNKLGICSYERKDHQCAGWFTNMYATNFFSTWTCTFLDTA